MSQPRIRISGPAISLGSTERWSPNLNATGMVFTGTNSTYPTYNSYYVKNGQIVSFFIQIDCDTITNFGSGQIKTELPFYPLLNAANHFSAWCWVDPSQPADELNGHIQLVADNLPGNKSLDFHWIGLATPNPKPVIEHLFYQGSPVTLTNNSKIYVNGTYITRE